MSVPCLSQVRLTQVTVSGPTWERFEGRCMYPSKDVVFYGLFTICMSFSYTLYSSLKVLSWPVRRLSETSSCLEGFPRLETHPVGSSRCLLGDVDVEAPEVTPVLSVGVPLPSSSPETLCGKDRTKEYFPIVKRFPSRTWSQPVSSAGKGK